jgi:predicted hydrocarbon binding protein
MAGLMSMQSAQAAAVNNRTNMTEPLRTFPPSLLRQFILTAIAELGPNELAQIFENTNLATNLLDVDAVSSLNSIQAADSYASIQRTLRVYYGRGFRGVLLRIGRNLWESILHELTIGDRMLAAGLKVIPAGSRQKPALELLARTLRGGEGSVSVHTLDLNLLFVDASSPTTVGLSEPQPVCYVTLGLIQGLLYWATGVDYEVEETGCRATGNDTCEFKIVVPRK